MYKSPIEITFGAMKMVEKQNDEIEKYVYEYMQEIGVNVDREELLKALRYDRDQYEKGYADGKNSVNHGRWKTKVIHDTYCFQCSACNSIYNGDTHYCPHCGAKMDGGAER